MEKMKRVDCMRIMPLMLMLVASFIGVCVSSCSKEGTEPEQPLVGKWMASGEDSDGDWIETWEFKSSGRFVYEWYEGDGLVKATGDWSVLGEKLVIEWDDEPGYKAVLNFKVTGSTLKLREVGESKWLTYERI